MPAFGNRLKHVRDEFGETVRDFSDRLGVARQTIYDWYKLEEPTQKALGALVSAYPTISVEWLKTGEGEMLSSDQADAGQELQSGAGRLQRYQQSRTVEFFDPEYMRVAASNGGIVPFNEWRRIGVDLPTVLLRKLIGTPLPSIIHAWEIDGDSMKPEIGPGDIIFTTPAEDIYDAGRYLLSMDGGLMLKKVQRLGGGVLRIIPENPDYYVEDLKPVDQGWLSMETDLMVEFYVRGRFLAVLRPYELDDPVMHGMNKLIRMLAEEGVISRKR